MRLNLKHGCDGDKGGWQFVLSVQPVLLLQPLIVEYEMVANALEVHDAAEVVFVAGAYKKAEYRVLAFKVTMQQYGDIVNKNRLMLVATHPCLKEHGEQYRLPIGDFSDAVGYCARDIVEPKIAESQKRRFPEKPVKPWRTTPGALQVVARYAPGQGFSDRVHASCLLDGLLPATTNHGGGRHMLPDWRPGDPVGQSAMFTIDTSRCARAQNLPDDYLPYMQQFNSDPKFLFRAVSMGYGQRFAYTLSRSYHDLLLKAGVPFDIEATASTQATKTVPSKVRHRVMEESKWLRWRKTSGTRYQLDDDFEPLTSKRKADLKAAAMQVEWSLEPATYVQQVLHSGSLSGTGGPSEAFSLEASGIEILDAALRTASRERASQQSGVMKAVFDTGAQMIILADEDVGSYIYDGKSTAQMAIVPAAKGSEFTPRNVAS